MKNQLTHQNSIFESLLSIDDGTNSVYVNGTELAQSSWLGTGNYTFTSGGVTVTIRRIAEITGDLILMQESDNVFYLACVNESAVEVDVENAAITFTQASSRTNINSGETVRTLFGKIKKWLADLKAVAFSGSYNDLSDKPTIPSYSAGTNVQISNGVISATDTKYSAGTNVQISNGVISATDTKYSITEYGATPASLAEFVQATATGSLQSTFKFRDANNVLGLGADWVKGIIQYQNAYGSQYGVGGVGLVSKQDGVWYQIAIGGNTTSVSVTSRTPVITGVKGNAEGAYRTGNVNITAANLGFVWSGQSGQPTWLWGGNALNDYKVWNPSNFSVNYANSAANATNATRATSAATADLANSIKFATVATFDARDTNGITIPRTARFFGIEIMDANNIFHSFFIYAHPNSILDQNNSRDYVSGYFYNDKYRACIAIRVSRYNANTYRVAVLLSWCSCYINSTSPTTGVNAISSGGSGTGNYGYFV